LDIFEGTEMKMSANSGALPLIAIKVGPQSKADWPRFASAIASIAPTHPKVSTTIDSENCEALIGGVSELHLDGIIKELIRQGVTVKVSAPQVAYRETITRNVTKDYTHKKQTGGIGQFARVILEVGPNEKGAGNVFESMIINDSVPKEYIPGIEKGVNSVLNNGPLISFPVVDIKVRLIDGAYHDDDSSLLAFEIAARQAIRETFEQAGAVLLEPVMKVEVKSPEAFIGSITGDLNSRRGQIVDMSLRGDTNTINALVPLAQMFGYINNLRSMSQGRASFTMDYSHYQAVSPPPDDPENFPPAIGMRA
jgi:elongation factor G